VGRDGLERSEDCGTDQGQRERDHHGVLLSAAGFVALLPFTRSPSQSRGHRSRFRAPAGFGCMDAGLLAEPVWARHPPVTRDR